MQATFNSNNIKFFNLPNPILWIKKLKSEEFDGLPEDCNLDLFSLHCVKRC
jgi:hypothetical protein